MGKAEETSGATEVRWAPRVDQGRIRRLYTLDALGIVDAELIDHVGYALEARCLSILAVHDAQRGTVRCPRCARSHGEERAPVIRHTKRPDDVLRCPECGWEVTWAAYQRTFQRKQLNAGGARRVFEAFPHHFRRAIGPRQKMLAIDRLIHEFHYSLKDQPETPTRIAGVNLISGTMTEVIALLEDLAYGSGTSHEISATSNAWLVNEQRRRQAWASFARKAGGTRDTHDASVGGPA